MKRILTLIIFAALGLTKPSQSTPVEGMFIHKKIHMGIQSEYVNKIYLSIPEENIFDQLYNCTPQVKQVADDIFKDRPNGSEAFVIIENNLVIDLDLCHKHDGVIIECGKAL